MHAFATTYQRAAESPAFKNYLMVRDRVLSMLDHGMDGIAEPSRYWMEEIAGFDYMLDAPPSVISKLREHCYHLTGLHSYAYRRHHAHKSQPFVNKLAALRALDDKGLFIPESPLLGGYGHDIDGKLVNLDTLKFYETLIAMYRGGLLGRLGNGRNGNRPVVLEIGAGWGGFAYQMKTVAPHVTYVIIDLPPTLLFSATYLATHFPEAKVYVYGEDTIQTTLQSLDTYDFVFLPHYFIEQHTLPRLDLTINMVSFQEMTAQQVYGYVEWV